MMSSRDHHHPPRPLCQHQQGLRQVARKVPQEGHGRRAVYDPVVKSEAEGHHLPDGDLAIEYCRFFEHPANAQDTGFRWIEYRCEAIHAEVEKGVEEALSGTERGKETLAEMIKEYFKVCERMADHVLLMYQVTQFLPHQWQRRVLENELRITTIFIKALERLLGSRGFPELDKKTVELIGHNISVLGQMWAFRRWYLAKHFTIQEYTEYQTDFILGQIFETGAGD